MARRRMPMVSEIATAMVRETDRGCVLVSTTWMEDWLRLKIESMMMLAISQNKSYLVVNIDKMKSERDRILSGPLSGAFDRADFCVSLGLIKERTRVALRALFTLRNHHFGHFAGVSRLSDKEAEEALKNFLKAVKVVPDLVNAKWGRRRFSKARRQFMNSVLMLGAEMAEFVDPLSNATPIKPSFFGNQIYGRQ